MTAAPQALHAPPLALDLEAAPGADGRTRLTRRMTRYPWSFGRPYPGRDPAQPTLILPQQAGAGLLAGDRVRQRLTLAQDARLRLGAAGATLVLPPADPAAAPARSDWDWRLGPHSLALNEAEPHVLLPGARLDLRCDLHVDETAIYAGFEGVCLSEPAAGEGPAGAWRAETRIFRPDGRRLAIDRQQASAEAHRTLARLPLAPRAFGTLLLIAPPERRDALAAAFPDGPLDLPQVYAAASALRGGIGRAVRLAAAEGGALREAGKALMERAAEALALPPVDRPFR